MTFWYFLLLRIILFDFTRCSDSESVELNQTEWSPLYDAIIFRDITDIINELQNSEILPFDSFTPNIEYDNTEDLLSEYHRHLEKAYKQRQKYLNGPVKIRKIPTLKHDKFLKSKFNIDKYDNKFDNTIKSNGMLFSPIPNNFYKPLDYLIPFEVDLQKTSSFEPKVYQDELASFKTAFSKENNFDFSTVTRNSAVNKMPSSCFCKNGAIPCQCACKNCIVPLGRDYRKYDDFGPLSYSATNKMHSEMNPLFENNDSVLSKKSPVKLENNLNLRIKIDLQIPNLQENIKENFEAAGNWGKLSENDGLKEIGPTAINLSPPFINLPSFNEGYKRSSEFNTQNNSPFYKLLTIHKKKKARSNNNLKKQRKKVITYHNSFINLEPQKTLATWNKESNASNPRNVSVHTNESTIVSKVAASEIPKVILLDADNKTNHPNDVQTAYKNNEIENDPSTKYIINSTIEIPYINISERVKRNVPQNATKNDSNATKVLSKNMASKVNDTGNIKKVLTLKKGLLSDEELLYWPDSANISQATGNFKNVTTLLLEIEKLKSKNNFNVTKDIIRFNHTQVLQHVIFGDVDWNDIDTVAPVIVSLFGKYLKGVVTLCSKDICHSMKCEEKECLYRICKPGDRFKQRGHCAGSNNTETIPSLAPVLELPSNIASEVVDILQDKLLGNIYGKAIMCISSKCVTIMADKKIFLHYKCTTKNLKDGYCPISNQVNTVS